MKAELLHLKTITKHKYLVTKYCFKSGLYWQGIKHDLSKYSATEFGASAKYFQGTRSPINYAKETYGYSIAWQHHKGHNAHHWEYWVDWSQGKEYVIRMPLNYAYELVCDYLGAGQAYNSKDWNQNMPLEYFMKVLSNIRMHSETVYLVKEIFIDISLHGVDYACLKMKKKEYQYSRNGNFTEFVI
jgi:hypothetical protein